MFPIVREAGGTVTTIDGGTDLDARSLLVSNGLIHEEVLRILATR